MSHLWRTARRDLDYGERALVMAILNVTPDSFSDGGMIGGVDEALRQTEKFIAEGADIIDIGGESTRPGSSRVSIKEETLRVVPVIEAITKRFDIPNSVDTSKSEVAERAVAAGAEIINDISALRFDPKIADVAASHKTGLVLMHSRGDFESMHSQPPVSDIVREVSDELRCAIGKARRSGVPDENIVLDIGIGFGKTQEQNLELLAKLDKLTAEFSDYPVLVGTSRKSFIGKLLDGAPVNERLSGSLVTAAIAVWNGAKIVRVHDVKETVETLKIVRAVQDQL
jgi:dihydropteroate synthase